MHVSSIIRSKIVVKIVDTGPSSTYSRIPSPNDVGSGFRLRCKWNRFLFMTEYRTDGGRSVSAGHSSLLSFSFSLLSCPPTASMSPCSFLQTCRFFHQHATPDQGSAIRLANEQEKRGGAKTFCYIDFRCIDPLFEREFVARIDNCERRGKLGEAVLLEVECRLELKVFSSLLFFFYVL